MGPAYRAALVFHLAIGAVAAHSQNAPIPFDKLQRASQLQALEAANDPARAMTTGGSPSAFAVRGLVSSRPVRPVNRRVIDRRYVLLNGAHLGMALFDVAMSQHCMAEHRCSEANPIMPSSPAGQIGVSLGLVTFTAAGAYWARKHNLRGWWAGPAAGIAAHTAGAASGFALR